MVKDVQLSIKHSQRHNRWGCSCTSLAFGSISLNDLRSISTVKRHTHLSRKDISQGKVHVSSICIYQSYVCECYCFQFTSVYLKVNYQAKKSKFVFMYDLARDFHSWFSKLRYQSLCIAAPASICFTSRSLKTKQENFKAKTVCLKLTSWLHMMHAATLYYSLYNNLTCWE